MPSSALQSVLNRDFILAFFAMFAFASIFHVLTPTLPIYLSRIGSTEAEVGILMGIFGLSSLVARPFVGRALMKVEDKKFMAAGAVIYILTSLGYLLAKPFWPLLVLRLLQGIGFAFFHTASFTFVANTAGSAHRGQILGYFILSFNIAAAVAPSLGMLLVNNLGFSLLFWTCSILAFFSFLIISRLRTDKPAQQRWTSGEGSLLSRTAVPPSVTSGLALFMWSGMATFFPLHAVNNGVSNPGIFFTVVAIMLVLGRTFGGRFMDIPRIERIIMPCIATFIISLVTLAFSKTLSMFLIVAVLWGWGHAFLMPILIANAIERSPSSPAPAMGTFHAITDLGMTLGPVIMGVVVRLTDYSTMFLCLASIGVLDLIYFYFFCVKGDARRAS